MPELTETTPHDAVLKQALVALDKAQRAVWREGVTPEQIHVLLADARLAVAAVRQDLAERPELLKPLIGEYRPPRRRASA